MSMSKSRSEQRRADDFEAFVQRFLKALGYIQFEKHPKLGTKRADLLVSDGQGRFFVEAKSPHLMKGTLFDPDHCARVTKFEKDTTSYVKKKLGTLYQNCIMIGSWHGELGRGIAADEIRKWLEPLDPWVGREKELPTERDLWSWYGWLDIYEHSKAYIEHHPELEPEGVRIIKSQCPIYDDIPLYPFGRFSVSTSKPKQGKPQEWSCGWRLVRRDRHHPVASGFTFFGGAGAGGSRHRIEPTVKKAIKDYKKKLNLIEGQCPDLLRVPLILFIDGRTAEDNLDKDDLDLAFARGVWEGEPSKNYPEIPLGVIVLGSTTRGGNQSGGEIVGDFVLNPYWGRTSFPTVINPLLRPHRLRVWSVVKTLQQIQKRLEQH